LPEDYESVEGVETEIGRAGESEQYRNMLIRYLDELTMLYENLQAKVLRGRHDEDLINATISKMVSLMSHLLPKLEGGGEEAFKILEEFSPYKEWMTNISKPKTDHRESNRIPALYNLIIRAYNLLGLTTY